MRKNIIFLLFILIVSKKAFSATHNVMSLLQATGFAASMFFAGRAAKHAAKISSDSEAGFIALKV